MIIKLYKYVSMNNYFSDLLEYGIYAAKLSELNDPYEMIDINETENYRIVSLSKSWNKKILWAYYTGGHGCCVELKIDVPNDNSLLLKKVAYDKLSVFQEVRRKQGITESLFHKDKKFFEENETRVIFDCSNPNQRYWTILDDGRVFLKAKISTVFFSPSAQFALSQYNKIIKLIKEYNKRIENHNDKIVIKKMRVHDQKYLFVIDRVINDEE